MEAGLQVCRQGYNMLNLRIHCKVRHRQLLRSDTQLNPSSPDYQLSSLGLQFEPEARESSDDERAEEMPRLRSLP